MIVGASPSGKAVDFDSTIPRFESWRPSQIVLTDVGRRISILEPGERLTLVGIDRDGVGDALRAEPEGLRGALLLEAAVDGAVETIMGRLLDDLAELALDRWPHWDEAAAFAPWLRAATKRASAGHRPRFRKVAKTLEFAQLMRVLEPAGPILVAAVDPAAPARAAAAIQVLEWCAAQGASVVAAFATMPPLAPPYDRILYGALEVVREIEPVQARFIPRGPRPHHASAIEQRVEAALRRDPELGPLFVCNQIAPIPGPGTPPRVDLLWREGRVVVELDGPEHQGNPNFAQDRHRDYELLVAGYLVLRITNAQVETDLQRAIEKIRAVVRYRKSS